MNNFSYYMPTKIILDENVVTENSSLFKLHGSKALIVTGRSSSKINGSLDDVISSLEKEHINFCIFNEVEENPSVETVNKIATLGKNQNVDFIVGIGGGSPIDAAKAAGVLIKNSACSSECLFTDGSLKSIPLIAVPTTAGTGTEVTPYAILTDSITETKKGISQRIFPEYALLDPKYLMNTPDVVTINTAVDALSHLIEGYLSANADIISDAIAEKGFSLFSECIDSILNKNFTYETRKNLLIASTMAGMVITQAGTSLPHGMGYALTYFKNVPHGKANGLILKSYLEFCSDKVKVSKLLENLKFEGINELGDFLNKILEKDVFLTKEEIEAYAEAMASNKAKLKNHPSTVTKEDIKKMYFQSICITNF